MMVQGGFELLYAVLLFVMGVVMPMAMAKAPPGQPAAQGPSPLVMASLIGGVYLALGAALLIAGVLKLTAGFRNYRYRGRTLGIVALFSGLVTPGAKQPPGFDQLMGGMSQAVVVMQWVMVVGMAALWRIFYLVGVWYLAQPAVKALFAPAAPSGPQWS